MKTLRRALAALLAAGAVSVVALPVASACPLADWVRLQQQAQARHAAAVKARKKLHIAPEIRQQYVGGSYIP